MLIGVMAAAADRSALPLGGDRSPQVRVGDPGTDPWRAKVEPVPKWDDFGARRFCFSSMCRAPLGSDAKGLVFDRFSAAKVDIPGFRAYWGHV